MTHVDSIIVSTSASDGAPLSGVRLTSSTSVSPRRRSCFDSPFEPSQRLREVEQQLSMAVRAARALYHTTYDPLSSSTSGAGPSRSPSPQPPSQSVGGQRGAALCSVDPVTQVPHGLVSGEWKRMEDAITIPLRIQAVRQKRQEAWGSETFAER